MTWEPSELPVPAGANVGGADGGGADVDRTPVEHGTTDFGRAAMHVWRPLLEAESSR